MTRIGRRSQSPSRRCELLSPTVLRRGPYRLYFFAGDGAEPPHVHVERDDKEAKFWRRPIGLAEAWGYSERELRTIRRIVEESRVELMEAWDTFFGA